MSSRKKAPSPRKGVLSEESSRREKPLPERSKALPDERGARGGKEEEVVVEEVEEAARPRGGKLKAASPPGRKPTLAKNETRSFAKKQEDKPRPKQEEEDGDDVDLLGLLEKEGGAEWDLLPSSIPTSLSVLPLEDMVSFPGMVLPVILPEDRLKAWIPSIEASKRFVVLVTQRPDKEGEGAESFYRVGTVARVLRVFQTQDKGWIVAVQVFYRCSLEKVTKRKPFPVAKIKILEDLSPDSDRMLLDAMARNIREMLEEVATLTPNLPEEFVLFFRNLQIPSRLADFVATHFLKEIPLRQAWLEELSSRKRLEMATALLVKELEMLRLQKQLREELQERVEKAHRDYALREQLKLIHRELGEAGEEKDAELDRYLTRIADAKMTEEAKGRAEQELKRLRQLPPEAAEYNLIRTWLDWVCGLPWAKQSEDSLDIHQARKLLESEHYGLDRVKERILEFLAVRKRKPDQKGAILCLCGPPGVGKTSLGQSIAKAMGREFFRFSLGGMRDEAEIKGHRRTYVGAMPGKIIQGLSRVKAKNPVFVLDEIDKVGKDWRGDPASALLEALDPAQNDKFLDHYIDLPFDLSKVIFLATANDKDAIPAALLDRMDVIELPGYIPEEKVEIAAAYLLPRQLEAHGLTSKHLEISKAVLRDIVTHYTREAGVRQLERQIGAVCRKIAIKVVEAGDKGEKSKVKLSSEALSLYLGPPRHLGDWWVSRPRRLGVATGLAWTPLGGEILLLEATLYPGTGRLELTGKLGDVMTESSKIALSYLKANAARFGINLSTLKENDLHLHFPAGAIPKDGPSAGITIATAFLSLLGWKEGCHVNPHLAMTGEISLLGDVLPVGGIREKVVAAASAELKTLVLPEQNRKDFLDVPIAIREKVHVHFVSHYDEVLPLAFPSKFPPPAKVKPPVAPVVTPAKARPKPKLPRTLP